MPKVSVIIPVYNCEKYLNECLDSVQNQTYKDIEVICIDDGSNDGSFNIMNKHKIKDNRLILLTQKKSGVGAARNNGLKVAKGEYIYFVDADDYIEPNLIEECVKKLDETDADIICFNTEVIGDESSKLFKRAKKYCQLTFSGLLTMDDSIIDSTNIYVWNKLFRTDIIKQFGLLFPENLCYEDIGFTKSYYLCSKKIYFDMRRFYHYRIRTDSLMYKNFIKNKNMLDHFKNWNHILSVISQNKDIFKQKMNIIEKWFWEYYFMTKKMIKPEQFTELEELKEQYFTEFDKVRVSIV